MTNDLVAAIRRDNAHLFVNRTEVGIDVANLDGIEDIISVRDQDGRLDLFETKKVLPYTHLNGTHVLMLYLNGDLRYSSKAKTWRLWNEMVYDIVDPDTVPKMVGKFAKKYSDVLNAAEEQCIQDAADFLALPENVAILAGTDEDEKKRVRQEAAVLRGRFGLLFHKHQEYELKIHNTRGYNDLVRMMERECAKSEDLYDADTSIFVLENGVLDLDRTTSTQSVHLMTHDPIRNVTKFAPVKYVPDATAPVWEHYLETSIPDEASRRYLQRWCGAAMLGKPVDKGFMNLLGPTDSGKSVFVWAIQKLMGDYAGSEPPSTFTKKRGGGEKHFDLHELRGKRFIVTSETGDGEALDDDLLKRLTGEDQQKTRTLFQGFVSWVPQCTIFISSNHELRFNTGDTAMANRYKPIKFPNTFSRSASAPVEQRADLTLKDKLKNELPGMLNWFLAGLVDYATNGMGDEPASVTANRDEIIRKIDTRYEWFEEMMRLGRIMEVPKDQLEDFNALPKVHRLKVGDAYQSYSMWCALNGIKSPYNQTNFAKAITARYPEKTQSGGVRWLQLTKTDRWGLSEDVIEAQSAGGELTSIHHSL